MYQLIQNYEQHPVKRSSKLKKGLFLLKPGSSPGVLFVSAADSLPRN